MKLEPNYIIGDLHLGNDCKLFEKVYHKDFDSINEYHSEIVKRWNKKVPNNESIVLVLGDLGKQEAIENILPKLRGRKFLILGNHDNLPKSFYEKYFEEVYDYPIFTHSRIVFSHIPIPTEPGVINYHGHTHHVLLDSERHFNLCPEHHNYTPILYKKLFSRLSKIEKPNHKFLEEWYADIQLTTEKPGTREEIVVKENGLIDIEASKPLLFLKEYKKKINKGLEDPKSDEEILEIYKRRR